MRRRFIGGWNGEPKDEDFYYDKTEMLFDQDIDFFDQEVEIDVDFAEEECLTNDILLHQITTQKGGKTSDYLLK